MYKTEIIDLNVAGKNFRLHQVTNVDEVFDALIHAPATDIEVVDERIPYWTEIWPSALALAEFIQINGEDFAHKDCIEIGSGLALPSLVAAGFCKNVTITDYLQPALDFAKENARENEIHNLQFALLDWRKIDGWPKFDMVLASDIAYEKRAFEFIPTAISSLLKPDAVCYLAEPGRTMAKDFFEKELPSIFDCQKKYEKIINWRGVDTRVSIYAIRKK